MGLELSPRARSGGRQFALVLLLLAAVLSVLFYRSFLPGRVLFSTDGPIGLWLAACHEVAAGLTGIWQDLSSVGTDEGSFTAGITSALLLVLGPMGYAKFYPPITLLILGVSAWCCFRQWKLAPQACVLGALAAVLNSGWFSGSCWGVGSQMIAAGMGFLALAALAGAFPAAEPEPTAATQPKAPTQSPGGWRRWGRVLLAGVAVGLGVLEGADIGGLLSVTVAAFAVFQACARPGALGSKLAGGLGRVVVIALVALLVAAQGIVSLVQTNITGISGMQQDAATRQEHWDWATQWSLPKREALELIVPGLFGYRMDAPDGAGYWGAAGRDPAWDRYFASGQTGPRPAGMMRYSGGGLYAGTLVCCLAFWALLRALRREDRVFSRGQKQVIWFWGAAALGSLLLSFGRFAPFYGWFYALPYVSTVRNPAKFMHIVEWTLVILFAYGVDGLVRRYLQAVPAQLLAGPNGSRLKRWWATLDSFDQQWFKGLLAALQLSLIGWLIYALLRPRLVDYLQQVDFDSAEAAAVASFSVRQPGWFILFFGLSLLLLGLVLGKALSGRRARLGTVLLGALLIVDLGRADLPWLVYWDYPTKYATNPVLEELRQEPFQHRVAVWPFPDTQAQVMLDKLYRLEWLQHQFRAFNIQSLDIVQMRSRPADLVAFETALHFDGTTNTVHRVARRWQLTNTRYLLGTTNLLPVLNGQLAPEGTRFVVRRQFQIMPRPGIAMATHTDELTAGLRPAAPFALFEFTGALPRARLYANWEVQTNAPALLEELASPTFSPQQTVLVSQPLPPPPLVPATNLAPAGVEFLSYSPKRVLLRAQAASPSVLLLNDRFDPQWSVTVDGHPAPLLRCNSLMRGVYLAPGPHQVEFSFRRPVRLFYVSLATVLAGLLLLGVLAASRKSCQEARGQ